MLILTRKVGEAIVIGDNVTVKLLEMKGGQVKLGVDAPDNITINREEVYLRILEENKKAAVQAEPNDLAKLSGLLTKQ
jgi:carbon storage regulator